jgi:carbon monoxide dehydrogenase subunit G
MISVERSGTIAATPEEVWAVLSDFAAISAWAPNVDHSCLLTEQATGVGTARRIQAGRTTLVETVAEWTPPTDDTTAVLSYALTGLPKVVRSVTNTWNLKRDRAGTAVTLTSTIDAGSRPPQKVVARIVGRKLASASDEMIAGLTDHIAGQLATTEKNA